MYIKSEIRRWQNQAKSDFQHEIGAILENVILLTSVDISEKECILDITDNIRRNIRYIRVYSTIINASYQEMLENGYS